MKLTKKGEYALRAMIALGRAGGESMTISHIAAIQEIPKKFLEQILLALKSAGLVVSKAGPRGGYELGCEATRITVGKILNAVEEPISLNTSEVESSPTYDPGIQELLTDIRHYVRQKLESVSLAQLTSDSLSDEQVEALMWYI